MIIDLLIQLATGVFGGIADALPRFSNAEGVIVTAGTFILPLAAGMASLGAWVPWGTVAIVLPMVTAVYVASFSLRILRVLLGHVPLVGGNG